MKSKLYAIYQIRNRYNELLEIPYLYAFTNKEYLLESFKKIRNMNIFKVIKKEVSQSEYTTFANRHRTKELVRQSMYTKSSLTTGKEQIELVSSWYELENAVLHSDRIIEEAAKYTNGAISILKKGYIQALIALGYLDIFKFANPISHSKNPLTSGLNDQRYVIEDYQKDNRLIDFDFDEFSLLMHFYGWTFK